MKWIHALQELALKEGWGLFDNPDHGYRIERYDDAKRFTSDAAAIAYVGMRAIHGNSLAIVAFHSLASEYDIHIDDD